MHSITDCCNIGEEIEHKNQLTCKAEANSFIQFLPLGKLKSPAVDSFPTTFVIFGTSLSLQTAELAFDA